MHRSEQIQRIRTLETELDACLARVGRSSRGPLGAIRRLRGWPLAGSGFLLGALLARVSARHIMARVAYGALLAMRAQRFVVRCLQSV